MALAASRKQDAIQGNRRHDGDTGSPEVQISLLTARVSELSEHLKTHRKDFAGRRGLVMMVGRRNRLLRYLSRKDPDAYRALIKRLGLRK